MPHPFNSQQDTWPLSFPHSANHGGGAQNNALNTMPRGDSFSLQFGMPNQYSHAAKMGMTFANSFEARMHPEEMEQLNQQQRQMQMLQPNNNQPHANASSMFNQQQSAPPAMRFYGGSNYGSSNMEGHTGIIGADPQPSSIIDLATRIMMNEPSLSLRQAIEMAMQIQNQHKQS